MVMVVEGPPVTRLRAQDTERLYFAWTASGVFYGRGARYGFNPDVLRKSHRLQPGVGYPRGLPKLKRLQPKEHLLNFLNLKLADVKILSHYVLQYGVPIKRAGWHSPAAPEDAEYPELQRHCALVSPKGRAEAADLDRAYVSGCERGRRNLSLLNIWKLAGALNVAAPELLQPPASP